MSVKGWDPGFYADGSFGWDHVRDRLSYLLGAYVSDVAPGIYRKREDEIISLQSELDKEPSYDAREEDDALDLLNEAAEECGAEERWYFDGYAGGLMYGVDDDDDHGDCYSCSECGADGTRRGARPPFVPLTAIAATLGSRR